MKQLFIAFFISFIIYGQENFSGRVVDTENLPLSEVIIKIQDSDKQFFTNTEGIFNFAGKFNLESEVVFRRLGYEEKKVKLKELLLFQNWVLKSKVILSQTVLVKATLGEKGNTPITFSELSKNEIINNYYFQDVPEMLSYLPSTTFYSEGGNGIGYNYLNIRGFDQRRISVAINGIPQNDPEDHNVYWIDFPDILQDAELIQVQRGSGSGIIGYPSLGGSINIISSSFSNEPKVKFSSVFGSYNSRKYNIAAGSGLIQDKYSFFIRLSKFQSSGYRKDNWVNINSYYLSAVRFDKSLTTQINIFGAPIADGLTYTGLPKFVIKNRIERQKNYSYWEADKSNYTYKLERRKDEIENFYQPHFEILNDWEITKNLKFNSALFWVIGEGFFDYDGSWADTNYFRLTKQNGFNPLTNPGNTLIRATVKNNQWGWIPKLSIEHDNGTLFIGGEFRFHKSNHFGNINFAESLPVGVTKDYRYYDYDGQKDIFNFFVHEQYKVNESINLIGEIQLAYNKYRLFNEKFIGTDFSISNFFLNPRIGINYKQNEYLSYYAVIARTAKEPRLKNYYDAAESSGGSIPQFEVDSYGNYDFEKPFVNPEFMNNIEFGINWFDKLLTFNMNFYYMLFNDEIVNQGQLDRFGQPVTGNIEKTIHTGIEFNLTSSITDEIEINFNSTYGKNFISRGFYYIDQDNFVVLDGNEIGGFPNFMFNAIIKMKFDNFNLQLSNKYVGEFYSDNFDNKLKSYLTKYPAFVDYEDNVNPSYFVTNLMISYENNFIPNFNGIRVFMQVNNLWNNLYSAYAIGKEYFPAAERNFAIGMELKL